MFNFLHFTLALRRPSWMHHRIIQYFLVFLVLVANLLNYLKKILFDKYMGEISYYIYCAVPLMIGVQSPYIISYYNVI